MVRLSFGQKFQLILWKNWNVRLHHWRNGIFCVCVSFLFALLLIVLRCLVKIERVQVQKFQPIDLKTSWRAVMNITKEREKYLPSLEYNCLFPRVAIAYAPNTSDYVNLIMKKADTEYLDDVTLVSFATVSELKAAMISQYYFVGVKFNVKKKTNREKEKDASIYPNILSFSLLFPSELRQWEGLENFGNSWRTYKLYDMKKKPENQQNIDVDIIGYVREGFSSMQNAISMAYISLRVPDTELPIIKLQRFPHLDGTYDPLIQHLRFNVNFLLILGFLYPCLYITLSFNKEKQQNILTFLHIMGISYTVQLFAWFINSFVMLFISSLFFIVALKGHWSDGFAVLQNSSWLAVLTLMTAYIFASISFTFMVCSFFIRRSTATLMLVLLWFFTYLPSLMSVFIDTSIYTKLLICIFPNCCMSIALEQIFQYESLGEGFLWSSYFDNITIHTQLTNGVITIFLILLTILYALIGLCMLHWRAGFLETPKIITNTACFQAFKRLFKKPLSHDDNRTRSLAVLRSKRMSRAYEVNPDFKRTYVQIKGLQKIYKSTTVVMDFDLKLFEGEIMVLMGENGAGKSTLLSMITGMIKPTKGNIIINGIDTKEHSEGAFASLGLCLQENMLFPELNVYNQISFHCRLKGLSGEFLEREVQKYLLEMDMEEHRNQNTGELSIGLKRYLSVCCALCAESKFVVLDEPDTGMDFWQRKKFRDLLILEKIDRTILLVTHSTEEADYLGDRIAIMSGGDLKCYGTSNFLRKVYSTGFRLVCVKDEHCDSSVVTAAIKTFIPVRLVPETEVGTELAYRLNQKYQRVFPHILDYLEQNLSQLNIVSVSISESSIDDVFLSMCSDNAFGGDRTRLTDVSVSSGFDEEANFKFLQKTKNYKGFQLLLSQWNALLLKRFLYNVRVRPIVFLQFLLPIMFTAASFPIATMQNVNQNLAPMTYRLHQYPESITVLDIREEYLEDFEKLIIDHYKEIINSMGIEHKIAETGGRLFNEYILDYVNMKQSHINVKYLIAASFSRNELKAWYNDYPLHTVPLALNIMHNAVLRAATNDDDALINVTLEPLPRMLPEHFYKWYSELNVGSVMAINLTLCIGLVWSTGIMFLIKERQYDFKLIQYIHGVRPSSYWHTVFFYDFALTITISTAIIVVILCFQHNVFMVTELLAYYFFTLVVFGTCILPFNYAISWIFDDIITAFCVLTVFSLFGGITFCTFINVLEGKYTTFLNSVKSIEWIMQIVPHFALSNTLAKIYHNKKMKILCSNGAFKGRAAILKHFKNCHRKPYCCEERMLWSWSHGLLPEWISVVAVGICSTIAMVIIELRSVSQAGIFGTNIPEDNEKAAKEDFEEWHGGDRPKDESSEQERIRVLALRPKDYMEKALIMKSVGKIQKRTEELHRIFLVINHSDCFGLFGSSASGKTAFMKMLVQNKASSYGQIFVHGISLRSNIYKVFDQISYCQQISTNVDEFTGFEVLKIFCMLHGIPRKEINPICEGLASLFGYMSKYKELIKFYSPGIKRRFRTSIAMLGNPSIIYLDEPFIGLDLVAMRKLCHIICQVCRSGTSVLFTSLHYKLTEIMCSRFAFIANGRLSHIGNPYELNKLHFNGYLVKIKLKKISIDTSEIEFGSIESAFIPNPLLKAQTFVEMTFPNAVMKDQRGDVMFFFIPAENMKISHIFKELQRNSFLLDIETFLVSHDTLPLFIYETVEKSKLLSRSYFTTSLLNLNLRS